jgi:hypothetical protein
VRNILSCILIFLSTSVFSENDSIYTIKARFLQDSFRIGEHIQYCVTAHYPKTKVAVFPDSSFQYFPFEYIQKIYFPTKSDSLYAIDSVIYILSCYEIKNKQYLSVPITFIDNADTIRKIAQSDSIFLIHLVKNAAAVDLIDEAHLSKVPKRFNYPYVLTEFIVFLFLVYILYTIFGKMIVTRYRLFILRRSHNRFIKDFDKLTDRFNDNIDLRLIEQTLALWKNYLTRLEAKPINTYTTKELILLYDQESLESSLQSLDRNVYGGMITKDTSEALQVIKRFTNRRFQLRRREITSG